nr:PliI family lysozyme inhibitor of I-type lysozyme [Shewanella submarina]
MYSFKLPLITVFTTILLSGCGHLTSDPSAINVSASSPALSQSNISTHGSGIFSQVIKLDDGRDLVITEGSDEPRSIGSVTALLYRNLDVGDFETGLSFAREGFVTDAVLQQPGKVKVTTTSAGSGSYLQEYYICIGKASLNLCDAGLE